MRKISRAKAIELGLARFFTGAKCRHNHVAQRYAHDGRCCECTLVYFQSPRGRAAVHRGNTSSKGRETQRRHRTTGKYLDARLRYDGSPKGKNKKRESRDNDEYRAQDNAYHKTPEQLEKARRRDREHRLDQACDTSRDDFDPVRMYRLLALWNKRENAQ
jgi:hypothetical protein